MADIGGEACRAEARLAQGRFYVALVGQLKRGKSSLLNALVGKELLPTGIVPVTSVVTVVRHGVRSGARVLSSDGEWSNIALDAIHEFVSETRNPGNERGVALVEVFDPSPLLDAGMCLVDTPGIGSVIEANSAATHAFVPHIDSALVVLGADPPLSAEELALIAELARTVPDLVFVLSKADRFSERERREAIDFTRRVLARRLACPEPEILEVSALASLGGSGSGSGWLALTSRLAELSRDSGRLIRDAERREAMRLARRIAGEVAERREVLLRPLHEAERRRTALAESIAEGERKLGDLSALLGAEVERLASALMARRDSFLGETLAEASRELAWRLETEDARLSREAAVDIARQIARDRIERWASREAPETERRYGEAMQRFHQMANEFLARFVRAGEPGLSALTESSGGVRGFRSQSRRTYSEMMAATSPSPWTVLLDRLSPPRSARHRAALAASRVLERLVVTNSARVQNDLLERVADSRRQLESEVRRRLTDALRSATSAFERASALRAAGETAVAAEVEMLDRAAASAAALLAEAGA